MRLKRRIVIVILAAVLGGAALGAVLWRLRAPLLLVLDEEFIVLYGSGRGVVKKAGLSLRMFRPVAVARIAEGASPDVVAFAAAAAAARPYAALFPARLRQGARRYAEQAPGIPVGVLGGGALSRQAENEGFRLIETDKRTDLYRAGRCAALFALRGGGGTLFFAGDLIDRDDREAFARGLRDQGVADPPVFVDRGTDYALPEGLSCVVMTAPAENFPENNNDLPIILFSWIDPGFTARGVKLIFDDSPWALAFESAQALQRQGELPPAASEVLALWDRIGDADLRRDLKQALKSSVPP
ncbi:MAG: hypothetical protein LBU16_06195 [Treponema sp.]|jgi:hypothetical protein|nr:hypothetical protein [Treponema sp.]